MHSNQKRHKIFYGWLVVGVCLVIGLYAAGAIVLGFTAAFEPLADEFGWSYAVISLAASLRGLEIGLLAPIVGSLADRFGPKRPIILGVLLSGLGLILLSRVNSLVMFYVVFLLIAIGTSCLNTTVFMTTVVNWFRKRIAMATGIVASGFGLGGLLVPAVTALIDMLGWRRAMVGIGLGMWVIGLPLALLVRNRPEQYGYLPDGETESTVVAEKDLSSLQTPEVNIKGRQAIRSSPFWHIAISMMIQHAGVIVLITHVMPYLSSIGIARSTAGLVASATPLISIMGRLGGGWLGDRSNKKRMLMVCFALMTLGMLCFSSVEIGGTGLLIVFLLLFGIGWGGYVVSGAALMRDYFGRRSFGTIYGFATGIMMIGNMTGPPIAGWVFDRWGSYQGVWLSFAALGLVSIFIVLTTPSIRSFRQTQ